MFGIDEIYESLLLEAKSPEEIKKILTYQFVDGKGVPQEVFEKVFELDPTKKKSYTKWVLMQWENSASQIEMAIKHGTLKSMFKYFQERANTGLNLVAMPSFDAAIEKLPDNDPIFGPVSSEDTELPENDFEIVYDSSDWRIAVPHTYEASKKLGRGCRWCTAEGFGDTDHHYLNYTSYGPLWVNFDLRKPEITPMDKKEYPYTRYQFCFEARVDGELMDCNDHRINPRKIDMPEQVLEFYNSKKEEYYDILTNTNSAEKKRMKYEEERLNLKINIVTGHTYGDLFLLPRYSYDYVLRDSDEWCVFCEDDIIDPLMSAVDKNNPLSMVNNNLGVYIFNKVGEKPHGIVGPERNRDEWAVIAYEAKTLINKDNFLFFENEDDVYCVTKGAFPIGVYNCISPKYGVDEVIKDVQVIEKLGKVFLQINWNIQGCSSLFEIDLDEKISECIIRKDWPKNGIFELKQDENGIYIEGVLGRYNISEPNDNEIRFTYSSTGFDIFEKLETKNGVKYIVEDEDGYALYNPLTKQKEIEAKSWLYVDEDNGLINFLLMPRNYRLYNFKKDVFYDIESTMPISIICRGYAYEVKSKKGTCIFNLPMEKLIGPFRHIYHYTNDYGLVDCWTEEGLILYNAKKDEEVCKGRTVFAALNTNRTVYYIEDGNHDCIIYKMDGERLYLGKSDKITIRTYLDVFFIVQDRGTASRHDKYSVDGLFYFFAINGDSFKPILNQEGLKSMLVGPKGGVFMQDISYDNGSIKITYTGPLTGEYNIYCDPSNGQIVRAEGADEEMLNTIKQHITSQQVQISEQFKNLMNRINNLY